MIYGNQILRSSSIKIATRMVFKRNSLLPSDLTHIVYDWMNEMNAGILTRGGVYSLWNDHQKVTALKLRQHKMNHFTEAVIKMQLHSNCASSCIWLDDYIRQASILFYGWYYFYWYIISSSSKTWSCCINNAVSYQLNTMNRFIFFRVMKRMQCTFKDARLR